MFDSLIRSRWFICHSEMVFQVPLFKAPVQLFVSMGPVHHVKELHFMGVMLSAMLILVTCKQCSVNDVQNLIEFEACRSNRGNFDSFCSTFSGEIIDLELVLRHSYEQCSHEDICAFPKSFWSISALTGLFVNDAESEALGASGVKSEGFSSGFRQMTGYLSRSSCPGIFRSLGGRSNTCFFSRHDGFPVFPSSDRSSKWDQQTDSSCTGPLNHKNDHSSKSVENTEATISAVSNDLSTPPVEVKPSILDLGHKNMFYSIGRWRKNSSLLESLGDVLQVEDVTAWISTSSQNNFCSSKSICHLYGMNDSNDYITPSPEDWLAVERGDSGRPHIAMRSRKNWAAGLRTTEIIMELDVSYNYEGKFVSSFCLQLHRCPNSEAHTAIVHLEAVLRLDTTPETDHSSLLLGIIVPCIDSSARDRKEMKNVDYTAPRGRFSCQIMQPPSEIKVMNTREADELAPRKNWKSQGIARSMSVLHENGLLLHKVLDGNYSPQWIFVRNQSQELALMDLILNSVEDVCNCNILVGRKSICLISLALLEGNDPVQNDLSAAGVHSVLELALASDPIIMHTKASTPLHVLDFCKRYVFWIWFWQAMFAILLAASLPVVLLFLQVAAFPSEDIRWRTNPSCSVICTLNSLHTIWKNSGATSPQLKALLLESYNRCHEGFAAPCQGLVNPSEHQKQTNSSEIEINSISAKLSSPSSTESFNMQNSSDSKNLRVTAGKEKGRRRRKKKGSVAGTLLSSEVSSSQSSNSTPSSWRSAVTFTVSKQSLSSCPATEKLKNPNSGEPVKQSGKSTCSTKDNLLANGVPMRSGSDNNSSTCVLDKPSLVTRVAAAAIHNVDQAIQPQTTCHTPFLTSKSRIDPSARAPGTKLHSLKSKHEEKNTGVQRMYTYDIWGDHLFGHGSTYLSKVISGMPSSSLSSSGKEDNWESFFIRDPRALITSETKFGGKWY